MQIEKQLLVLIEHRAYGLIMHWVSKASPHEVGGLWEVKQDGDTLICSNPVLSKQRSATDELYLNHDPNWLMDYQEKMGLLGKELPVATYGSWHSHGKGGVSPSSDDAEFIDSMTSRGMFVTTIFNARAEYKSQVHTIIGKPGDKAVVLVEIPCTTGLADGLTTAEREKADKDFDSLVSWYKRDTKEEPHYLTSSSSWDDRRERHGIDKNWADNVVRTTLPASKGHTRVHMMKTTDGHTLEVFPDGTLSFKGRGIDFEKVTITRVILEHLSTVLSKKQFKRVAKYAASSGSQPLSPSPSV